MADENAPKKETVRINVPPKPAEASSTIKRETVRINVPGKTGSSEGPRTDSSALPGMSGAGTPPQAPRPFVPPSPAGGAPLPPVKPLPGVGPTPPPGVPRPPTPPTIGAKPTAPALRPAAPGGAPTIPGGAPKPPTAATYSGTQPVTMKAAAPKKETARIQVGAQAQMPKATVRMQSTQPLSPMPAPVVRTAEPLNTAATSDDGMIVPLSWAALLISLIAFVVSYLAYTT